MRELPEDDAGRLREYYRHFAEVEAAPVSPLYAEWARAAADDDVVLERLLQLPASRRQANLLFAAARLHGVPVGPWAEAREHIVEHWEGIARTMRVRRTQTNEAGRMAVLNLAFARIAEQTGKPLALIEVGASAGLCLYPDAWPVRYTERAVQEAGSGASGTESSGRAQGAEHCAHTVLRPAGDLRSRVELDCQLRGVAPPARLPEVAWRAGIDLNPIDAGDADARAWLDTLIWPGQETRRHRLRNALDIAARERPRVVGGDLLQALPDLAAQAPAEATLVVFHSAVLAYLDAESRAGFVEMVGALPGHWISNEGRSVLPVSADLDMADAGKFVLAVDGVPRALTDPHGGAVTSLDA